MTPSLDLGVVGNCSFGALLDARARIVWCCLPRFDGDPVFHSLLGRSDTTDEPRGFWEIELLAFAHAEQRYEGNTAVLVTRLTDDDGNAVEIVDFAPRFTLHGRQFRPLTLVRCVRPVAGRPRIVVRLRPMFDHGRVRPLTTHGSNHVRYVGPDATLRLTTDAPVSYVLAETPFVLEEPAAFLLGPDETLGDSVATIARDFLERTLDHWREWVRRLALPFEWQDAVIRAAITLKLCLFEDTGAIVAALTTSIPEARGTTRNWDYRYCWLRDAFFVVRALNSLSDVDTMERYLRYLHNVALVDEAPRLQPVFGVALETSLVEREVDWLEGYRGHRPVRVGNQAYEHFQHDVYGNAILAATQSFFDKRLLRPSGRTDFERYESIGERAFAVYDTPDAGMWELRSRSRVHTSSALMCWAACDRLARIAGHLGLDDRARLWQSRAAQVRAAIDAHAWNPTIGSYAESFGGSDVDAGLLLMLEVGYLGADDPRIVGTIAEVERRLRRGDHLLRYSAPDDFGTPTTAFNICTFWYIDALSRTGRRAEARELFGRMLACRNSLGLLSEDFETDSRELWGNYPQTYSLVGIINAAVRLSRSWDEVV